MLREQMDDMDTEVEDEDIPHLMSEAEGESWDSILADAEDDLE